MAWEFIAQHQNILKTWMTHPLRHLLKYLCKVLFINEDRYTDGAICRLTEKDTAEDI